MRTDLSPVSAPRNPSPQPLPNHKHDGACVVCFLKFALAEKRVPFKDGMAHANHGIVILATSATG